MLIGYCKPQIDMHHWADHWKGTILVMASALIIWSPSIWEENGGDQPTNTV